MKIHWVRIALVAAATASVPVAEAQLCCTSTFVKQPSPIYTGTFVKQQDRPTEVPGPTPYRSHDGYLPPDRRGVPTPVPGPTLAALPKTAPPPPVVIHQGMGGSIPEHTARFRLLNHSGAKVEMRGPCYSACTLIMSYVVKESICFAPGAFLAFHSASYTAVPPYVPAPEATRLMYYSYPPEIRAWIDRNGGYEKMTTDSYWTMYDRELWAIGYARCAP